MRWSYADSSGPTFCVNGQFDPTYPAARSGKHRRMLCTQTWPAIRSTGRSTAVGSAPNFHRVVPTCSIGMMGAAQAATAAKLGERSPFNAIAVDVAARLDKGDLAGAAKRIKGLEIAWDGAEAGCKPRAAAQWHVPDKKIDAALKALRVKKPDASECRQTLDEVIMMMDQSSVKISNAQAQVLR